MKKILILLLLILPINSYATSVYHSDKKNLTVYDVSDSKTIAELKTQYNATDLRNITSDIENLVAQQRNLTIKNEEKKKLIDAKIREMAISELVKEGKLNNTGNTTAGE